MCVCERERVRERERERETSRRQKLKAKKARESFLFSLGESCLKSVTKNPKGQKSVYPSLKLFFKKRISELKVRVRFTKF